MTAHGTRYRAHEVRIRGSLERAVGKSIATEEEITAMARGAYLNGVIVFTQRMLERMKPFERAIVEGLAKNFHEQGGRT